MATTPTVTTQLIQLSPKIGEEHAAYSTAYQGFLDAAFDDGALDPKTRAAVALAAALVLGREAIVRPHLAAAKQAGLENEEIGQIAAIAEALKLGAHQHSGQATATTPAGPPKKKQTCC